jgi:hypothetical protein
MPAVVVLEVRDALSVGAHRGIGAAQRVRNRDGRSLGDLLLLDELLRSKVVDLAVAFLLLPRREVPDLELVPVVAVGLETEAQRIEPR